MNITAVVARKGGVGKTSTAVAIADAIAAAGKSVLLIDFDDQGNVALALGGEPGDAAFLFVVLDAFQPTVSRAYEAGGLWLLASNDRLRLGEIDTQTKGIAPLVAKLKTIAGFEHVVIDTKAGTSLALAAAKAADVIIVPTQPEALSVDGVFQQMAALDMAGATGERFVLPTMVDMQTRTHRAGMKMLNDHFPGSVLTSVPDRAAIRWAQEHGLLPSEVRNDPGIRDVVSAYRQAANLILAIASEKEKVFA
jgi:chromosome partitioning protein